MLAAIFAASSRSQVAGPSFDGIDKVEHFVAFGLVATAIVRLVPRRSALWVILFVSLYGASDEWHQSFTVGRSVEFVDWVADTLGAVVAVIAYRRWPAYRRLLEWRAPWPRPQRRIENPQAPIPMSRL